MFKLAEKIFLAGIGALALAYEKSNKVIADLVAIGHASKWEACRHLEELSALGEKKKNRLKECFFREIITELEIIKNRLARLEESLFSTSQLEKENKN